MKHKFLPLVALLVVTPCPASADPPVASYIFPAGGQRGKTVDVRVGGLNLHKSCAFHMQGPGVEASKQLQDTTTIWFEGPVIPLPDSQQVEDYPKDLAGKVKIAADALLGPRRWQLSTSQGATPSRTFIVGDLPEIVENEIDGDPVPVEVPMPVTINGRIFPREDVDIWVVQAKKGQTICCEVTAMRLGSPLDSRLEVLDPLGRRLAENDDYFGADSFLRFTAPEDGKYQVRIHDVNFRGGQAYVYRLTITADPYVDRTYPLGGRRGSKLRLELGGQGVPNQPVDLQLPTDGAGDYLQRLALNGKQTNPFLLDLDDFPEYLEAEPNDERAQVKPVTVPAVLNGRIDKPGDIDYWAFRASQGEALDLELRANRLGSPLMGVLAITDSAGKELQSAEAGASDPSCRFTPPAAGMYYVRVADRFHSRGGPEFAYRLRIARASTQPDFQLQLSSDAVTINRGTQEQSGGKRSAQDKQLRLKIAVERRNGFNEPINLMVDGLPAGVAATGTIAKNQAAGDLTFKADSSAKIQAVLVSVQGSAKLGDKMATRTATVAAPRGELAANQVLLAVGLPTPFQIVGEYDMRWAARGTMHHRHYRLERHGYDGPIEVSVADKQARHLQGVTGPTIIVPAGATEFDYGVHMATWMETGRTSRTCVMGTAVVKDTDGSEHTVSFTSTNNNEQLIAVIEPGRLDVELEKASLMVQPGETVELPLQVLRGKGLQGSAKIELVLPAHLHGIHADPLLVAANETHADLKVHFDKSVPGPFNMPVVVRATIMEKGEPVVGESKVEILGGR